MDFFLADDPDSVDNFVQWLNARTSWSGAIAIDTETRGLDWNEPRFTRLVQFGDNVSGWAVPVDWHPRLLHHALAQIREARVPVVMHNAKFDLHALRVAGLPLPHPECVHDTMVLHHLYRSDKPHGLKPIAEEAFGPDAVVGQYVLQEFMRKHSLDWSTVPVDNPMYWGYGVVDTILTRRVFDLLEEQTKHPAYDREMQYLDIMFRSETRGLRIDTEYSASLLAEWSADIANLALTLERDFGLENPNSNRQVEDALRKLDYEPAEFTETGQAKLDKPVLESIVAAGGPACEVVQLLVEYKQKTKWCSTYLVPFAQSGGRVHPSIRTLGARTGRSSITNPPLQTLPHTPHIRTAVLPEEGDRLYAIDFSGQEYRILASLSQDPAWLREFRTGRGDPHQLVADELGISRTQAKTFNFAMIYGAGVNKLASSTGLSVNAVKNFLGIYANRFPRVQEFKQRVENQQENYVETIAGRRAYCNPDQMYVLTNYQIQGSGADVLKEAACRLDQAGLADYIMVPVHDELVFSFPRTENNDCSPLAREAAEIMTNEDWFDVPLVVETEGPFENWGEKYE